MKTLPLQNYIDTGFSQLIKYNTLSARFGDGYRQDAPNGINNKIVTWSITYKNLDQENFTTVMNFLDSLKGAEHFYATPRGELQAEWILGDSEVQITETAVQHETDYTYKSITFTIERIN